MNMTAQQIEAAAAAAAEISHAMDLADQLDLPKDARRHYIRALATALGRLQDIGAVGPEALAAAEQARRARDASMVRIHHIRGYSHLPNAYLADAAVDCDNDQAAVQLAQNLKHAAAMAAGRYVTSTHLADAADLATATQPSH